MINFNNRVIHYFASYNFLHLDNNIKHYSESTSSFNNFIPSLFESNSYYGLMTSSHSLNNLNTNISYLSVFKPIKYSLKVFSGSILTPVIYLCLKIYALYSHSM